MAKRGALAQIFREAQDTLTQRNETVNRLLDEMATVTEPSQLPGGSGGVLPRQDHLLLLARDPDYQAEQLAKMPWLTPQERDQVRRDLVRAMQLFPETLPEAVGQVPPHPFEVPPA